MPSSRARQDLGLTVWEVEFIRIVVSSLKSLIVPKVSGLIPIPADLHGLRAT